ncbi:MAG: GNAT family N-acetyltransferase [Pseudomonadota bacterium]
MTEAPAPQEIRPARLTDVAAIRALLPDLAGFEVPPRRDPDDLWTGDAETLERWAQGRAPACLVHVAQSAAGIDGFTIVTLREELMSHAPSSHLEAIVVHERARGTGLGKRLLANAESAARAAGAGSMTLHVFGNNERARAVYRKSGYDEELIRSIKYLD